MKSLRQRRIDHMELLARAEEAKSGKSLRRTGTHVRKASRLRKRMDKAQAKEAKKHSPPPEES